jgi:glycosyltransferase involved in cell wall biosynthesis
VSDTKPEISVVIPTRNRSDLLPRAVTSVLAQEVPSLEIIVVDDASTDDTPDVLAQFGDRVRVVRLDRNVERGAARNIGARQARSDLLAFLDSDDEWLPGKLSRQLAVAGREVTSVTGINIIDERGATLQTGRVAPENAQHWIFRRNRFFGSPSSLVLPRSVFDEVGGFPQQWSVQGSEDWVFLARIVRAGHPVVVVREPLVQYRVHLGNSTADADRVAVSMWSAVQLMANDGMVSGAQLRRLRAETATVIARGFAARGKFRSAAAWWRRAVVAADRPNAVRATTLVALSAGAGVLRILGLR